MKHSWSVDLLILHNLMHCSEFLLKRLELVLTSAELKLTDTLTVQGTVRMLGSGANLDIDGDLNIDGGDLTTNAGTFNLLQSNALTVNAFGRQLH